MSDVIQGVVNWFRADRGFGFISYREEATGADKDVFVHYSGIKMNGYRLLYDGDKVEFVIVAGEKGPQAVNVVIIEPNESARKARNEGKTGKNGKEERRN